MKSYILGIVAVVLLNVAGLAEAQSSNPIQGLMAQATSNTSNNFIFGQTQTYYDLLDQIENKKVELDLLKKAPEQAESKISELIRNINGLEIDKTVLQGQIQTLQRQNPNGTDKITDLEQELEAIDDNIDENYQAIEILQATLENDGQAENEAKVEALKRDIADLEAEAEASQVKLRSYAGDFARKIMIAIGIILVATFLKWLARKIANRLNTYVNQRRREFILQLVKIAINVIAAIAILLVFFSQLLRTLPYLAIFATVVTLALRDVILSVIAWIIIGTKDGYKVGHYLKVGNLWGTVVEINPFNTVIRQGGFSGPTGRLITFPNKKIFEEFMENWSKWQNVTFMRFDFFLDQDSDFAKAEKIMLKILKKHQEPYLEFIEKRRKHLAKMGLREHEFEPMAFWQSQPNGILLRGKFLMDFDERFAIRASVVRDFSIAVAKDPDIKLRFVQNLNIPDSSPL